MHKVNWEDLRYFNAVGRLGSLSKAAQSLRVNHSTVFRHIISLEKALGVRLFDRVREGYLLTSAGEELFASTRQVDDTVSAASLKLSGRDQRLSGIIRITTTDSLGFIFLQPHLIRFHHAYPDIQIELITDNIFFNLTKRQADVAVRPTASPPENLVGRKTCKLQWGVYGSRNYFKNRTHPKTPEDLAEHDIVFVDETLSHISVMTWLRQYISEDNVVLYGGSVMTLFAAVKAGFGLSPLPTWLGNSDKELVEILPPMKEHTIRLWLLTHPDLRYSARIQSFIDFMAESLGTDYATLAELPSGRNGDAIDLP